MEWEAYLNWQIESSLCHGVERHSSLQEVNNKILETVSELKVSEAAQCQYPTFPPSAAPLCALLVWTCSPFPPSPTALRRLSLERR